MKEHIRAIVLATVKHSDRHNVTGVYTRERGRMAFLTPAGSSKKSQPAASCFQPLSVIEAEVNVSATRDLHIPSAVTRATVWRTLYYDPLKVTVAMFLSEFLNRLLRDAPPEPEMWQFIADSIAFLDASDDAGSIANFHITFLIGLMRFTGIYPDLSGYTEGMEFDMKSGRMTFPFSLQGGGRGLRINAERSRFLPVLARINYANSRHFHFRGHERSEILDDILRYYGCHFPGSDRLKSLDVFKEVFGC